MRSRLLVLFFALVSFVAIGCGDDGGTKLVDAKVFLDAPPQQIDAPAACTIDNMMNLGGTDGLVLQGMNMMPAVNDWFVVPTMGPNMGKTLFVIYAGLPGGTGDRMLIAIVRPMNGYVVNMPFTFETDATAATFNNIAYLEGDFNESTMEPTQFYYASSGALTFTAIPPAGDMPDASLITGTVGATGFSQVDAMTGAPIAGGCTANLASLQFNLRNMNMPFNGGENPELSRQAKETLGRFMKLQNLQFQSQQ